MSVWVIRLLYSSFSASLLICAVLLARAVFAKRAPRWIACMLWALVGVRLLVPFSIESELSVLPEIEMDRIEESLQTSTPVLQPQGNVSRADSATEERSEEVSAPDFFEEELSREDVSREEASREEISRPTVVPPAANDTSDDASQEESAENVFSEVSETVSEELSESTSESVMVPLGGAGTDTPSASAGTNGYTVAGIVWACGFGGLLLFAAVQYVLLRRRVAVFSLCEGGVRRCEMIDTPFVLGFFRPRIYLPFGLGADTESYVVAHERAHIQRLDNWSKLAAFLALAVHWFNPLVWVAFALFCKDIEYACDEKVVREMNTGERKAYATALLMCSVRQNVFSAFPVAFGVVGVKARIKNALSYKKPMLWVVIACLLLCVVFSVLFLTEPKSEDEASSQTSDISAETSDEQSAEESGEEPSDETSDESGEESVSEEYDKEIFAGLHYVALTSDYNPEIYQKGTPFSATTYLGGAVVRNNSRGEYLYVPDFSMPLCGTEHEGVIHLFAYKNGMIQTARIDGGEILTNDVGLTINGNMPNGSYDKPKDPVLYCSMVSETEGYLAVFARENGSIGLHHVLKTTDGGKSWRVQPKDILFHLTENQKEVSRVQFFENGLGVVVSTDLVSDIPNRITRNGGKNWESCMWNLDYPRWTSSADSRKITKFAYRDGTYSMLISVLKDGKQYQLKYTSADFSRWELVSDSFAAATPIERSDTPLEEHPYRYGYDACNRFLTDYPISYTVTEDEYLLLIMGAWGAPDEYIYIPTYIYKSGARHVMQANGEILLFTASSGEDTVHLLRIGGDSTWTETYLASNLDLTKATLDGNMLDENTGVVVVHDANRIACVLWTYDGGKTWETAGIDDASACLTETKNLTNAHFFDKNTALLITSPGDYDVTDVLTVTFDGGKTWENAELFMPEIGKEYTAFVTDFTIEDGMYVLEMSASTVLYDDNDLRYVSADLKNWTLTTEVPEFPEGIVRDYLPKNLSDLKFYPFGSLEPDREPPILHASDRGASVLYVPAWDEYIFVNERDLLTGGVSGDTVFIMKLLGDYEEGYSVELITVGDTVTRRTLLEDLLYYEPGAHCYMVSETEGYFFLTGIPQDDTMDREIAYLLWTEDGGKTWTVQNDHFLRSNGKEFLSVTQFFGKKTIVMSARCYYTERLEDRTVVTFDGGKTWQAFADLPYGDVSFAYTEIIEMDILEGKYWMRVMLSQGETEEMEFYSDDLINWTIAEN